MFTSDNESEPLSFNSHLDGVGSPNLSRKSHHLKPSFRSNSKCPFIPPLHALGRYCQVMRVLSIELSDIMWLDVNFLESDYLLGTVMNEYYEPTHDLTFINVQLYGIFGCTIYPRSWRNGWIKMMMSLKCPHNKCGLILGNILVTIIVTTNRVTNERKTSWKPQIY